MTAENESTWNSAWQYIFSNWGCVEWRPLPSTIKKTLGLHNSIGLCSSMLITRTGASGLNEFISRINSKHGGA